MSESTQHFGEYMEYVPTFKALHFELWRSDILKNPDGLDAGDHWDMICSNPEGMSKFIARAIMAIKRGKISLEGDLNNASVRTDAEGETINAESVETLNSTVGPCEVSVKNLSARLMRIARTFWTADNLNAGAKNGMLNRAWIDVDGRMQLSVKKTDTNEFQVPNGVKLTEADQAQFEAPGNYEWRDVVARHEDRGFPEGDPNTGRGFTLKRQLFKDGVSMIFENGKTIEWNGIHQEPNYGQSINHFKIDDSIEFADSVDCIDPSESS